MIKRIERKLLNYNLGINKWFLLSLTAVIFILIPNAAIILNIFTPINENFRHIMQYLMRDYIINTIILVGGTSLFSILIGVTSAWFVVVFDFPFRRQFEQLLMLPLAIPPYIGAYIYAGMLSYTGSVQIFMRDVLNLNLSQDFYSIMNLRGAVGIYTLFLYPYVYIIVRSFILKQSASYIEVSRTLSRGMTFIFFRVIIPIARPAIIGGVTLVILEVLNDYGVVKYFGINTFTTAIFRVWFGMADIDSSIKLAASLMILVFILIAFEKLARGRLRFNNTTTKSKPLQRKELKGVKKTAVMSFILTVLLFGFFIPLMQLIYWMTLIDFNFFTVKFMDVIINTVFVTTLASIITVIFAVAIANTVRLQDTVISKIFSKTATLGYSIPGAIIAVGLMIFSIGLDKLLPVVLTGSIVILIFAYFVRFITIAYNSVEIGFDKIGRSYYEAARSLGEGISGAFFKVEYPLMKSAVTGGFILVFIDILKELPLTLILRPFNFDTLAAKAYEYANDEMVYQAAPYSLGIIIIASVLIILFNMRNGKKIIKKL